MIPLKPQDISPETCKEILSSIREKVGKDLQIVVVIFDEERHRNFGHSCQLCTSEIFFQIASELAEHADGNHAH